MSRVRTVSDLGPAEIRGRRFLVRVDYNVPIGPDGSVTDATRVDATLETLTLLRDSGARIILVSHLGRPKGARDPAASLRPVANLLSDRLGTDVKFVETDPGAPETLAAAQALSDGDVALLENIRFQPGETEDDPGLSRELGALADGFVGDAFGVAHRSHASNVGAAREIRGRGGPAVAGLLMAREVHFLREALKDPARPFVAIMGGAKVSGKLELIHSILPLVDRLLIGGAMAHTFFRALGLTIGRSMVEEDLVGLATDLMREAGDKVLLPVDCVAADRIAPDATAGDVDRGAVGEDQCIGDIGPRTREIFGRELESAATVLWNGPMGVFEMQPFSRGTFHIAQVLAKAADRGAVVVVGGGDSSAAAHAAGVADRMTHISTGGGASLDLLAGKELPGLEALETVEV